MFVISRDFEDSDFEDSDLHNKQGKEHIFLALYCDLMSASDGT